MKARVLHIRDRLSGLSRINNSLENLDDKYRILQGTLLEMKNTLSSLGARPIAVQTVQIDQKTLLTKLFTGIKIYLDPQDISVAAHIAVDGVWEQQTSKAWLAVVKQNDTILDIGANFGYFGLLAGQFTNKKKSKIVLFEANKNLIPYINKSISVNWLNEQTKVENLAVSDRNGEVQLTILKDYLGSSSLQSVEELESTLHEKMQLEVEERVTVESTTIDSYCKNNSINEVDLIKMDIEGYEEKAYFGMRGVVNKSKRITLFIEFTKDDYDNPKKFYDTMLNDFGHVYIISDDGHIVKPKNVSYESIIGQSSDWVMPIFSKNPELDKEHNVVV